MICNALKKNGDECDYKGKNKWGGFCGYHKVVVRCLPCEKPSTPDVQPKKTKRVLELFRGTGSVGKVFKKEGWEVVSVDISADNGKPTHLADILLWDYKQYAVGEFDFIWASPPCNTFSNLKCCHIGKTMKSGEVMSWETITRDELTIGVPILRRTQEIIDYFKPKYWCMENPQTGRMKNHLEGVPFNDVGYCQYGFDYRKLTRLWNNIETWRPKKCGKSCTLYKQHNSLPNSLRDRYRIPLPLIEEMVACVV